MKKYYDKDKTKWHSRCVTLKIIKGLNNINNILIKKCKQCGNNKNLRIHHEVYHTKTLEIIDDILKNKIYYLCNSCHGKLNRII